MPVVEAHAFITKVHPFAEPNLGFMLELEKFYQFLQEKQDGPQSINTSGMPKPAPSPGGLAWNYTPIF
jgi:hypothetical protein